MSDNKKIEEIVTGLNLTTEDAKMMANMGVKLIHNNDSQTVSVYVSIPSTYKEVCISHNLKDPSEVKRIEDYVKSSFGFDQYGKLVPYSIWKELEMERLNNFDLDSDEASSLQGTVEGFVKSSETKSKDELEKIVEKFDERINSTSEFNVLKRESLSIAKSIVEAIIKKKK